MIEWRLRDGASFRKGDVLATTRSQLESAEGVAAGTGEVTAPHDGSGLSILVAHGAEIVAGLSSAVATARFCDHPAIVSRQCAVCGMINPSGDADGSDSGEHKRVTLGGEVSELVVSQAEALRLSAAEASRLTSSRKLQLIMDIDHTLLECTSRPPQFDFSGTTSILPLPLYSGRAMHWIKLRPGLLEFLEAASHHFEMTLYTNGKREYLLGVARALDPTKQLFADRLISTPDDVPDLNDCQAKSLERLFPGGIERCLVMDDRDDIWEGEQSRHLLLVKPYKFWKYHQQQQQGDVDDSCPQLQTCLDLLTRVHSRYYGHGGGSATPSPASPSSSLGSVADVLAVERNRVLSGSSFVFSGVFPMGTDVAASREALWVERLGGVVESSFSASSTHVIARVPGTDKVLGGVARGLHIVHLDWLWYTVWFCQRADEASLRLKNTPLGKPVPAATLSLIETTESTVEVMPAGESVGTTAAHVEGANSDDDDEDDDEDDLLRDVEFAIGGCP